MARIGILPLVRGSLLGLVAPARALAAVSSDARLSYRTAIPFLAVTGALWGIVHYRVVNNLWILHVPSHWVVASALGGYAVASVTAWAMTGAGLYAIARWFRRPVTLAWCDIAAWHLWMVWIVSLAFDFAHLLPGVSIRDIGAMWGGRVHFVMHIGWFYLFPMLAIQLVCCYRAITGCRRLSEAIGFALACLAIMRLGFRPLPELVSAYFIEQWGRTVDFWVVIAASAVVVGLGTVIARWWLGQRPQLSGVTAGTCQELG